MYKLNNVFHQQSLPGNKEVLWITCTKRILEGVLLIAQQYNLYDVFDQQSLPSNKGVLLIMCITQILAGVLVIAGCYYSPRCFCSPAPFTMGITPGSLGITPSTLGITSSITYRGFAPHCRGKTPTKSTQTGRVVPTETSKSGFIFFRIACYVNIAQCILGKPGSIFLG